MTSAIPTLTIPALASAWDGPAGVAARGTVIVLTGRGETALAYQRFGRRIAADAYPVRVVTTDLADLDGTRAEVERLLADPDLPAPKVLVGTDAGATWVAAVGRDLPGVDGVVLAGLALASSSIDGSWEAELAARSACPAHRRVISEDAAFDRGELGRALPLRLTETELAPSELPTLVIHGEADAVTPAHLAIDPLLGPASTRAVVVSGGSHDILNDVSHRSVAATVVLFLESLKLGRQLPPIVRPAAAG